MKPCRKCGLSDRFPSGPCRPCTKVREAGRVRDNKEYVKNYYQNNRDRILESTKQWIKNNPLKVKEQRKRFHSQNKHKFAEKASRRRANYSNLSVIYREECQKFYELARDCFSVSGQKYHVDHIIPINGGNVCGLHVPWNLQVLPSDLNESKGNKYE